MSLEAHGRDGGEVEAIQVDLYLESLLARRPVDPTIVDPALALTAQRLQAALPRFHPSFVFEEHLAERLRAVATGGRLDDAGVVVPFERRAASGNPDRSGGPRPVVLGGVLPRRPCRWRARPTWRGGCDVRPAPSPPGRRAP